MKWLEERIKQKPYALSHLTRKIKTLNQILPDFYCINPIENTN
jgi:hypothetical protein